MKNILIVDDEPRLLESIKAGLKVHQGSFSVRTALNGKEAVSLLASEQVDLVITDLKMPTMDGFELLAHISTHCPALPAIVMTAFSTPDIERKIEESTSLKLLEKPIDIDELAHSIFVSLERSSEEGSLTGISLASFLQLLETEQKTCLVEVSSGKQKGYLYFNHGELISAVYGKTKGEEAVYDMLLLEDIKIKIKKHLKRKYRKTINTPMLALLVEGSKRKDEKLDTYEPGVNQLDSDQTTVYDGGELPDFNLEIMNNQPGDNNMSDVKESLARLADVEGFMAVGIFTPNGEMAAQLNNAGLKLEEIGSMANDVLLKAQKATDMMDVGRGQVVHVEAPKAQIIARCLNENTDFAATEAGKAHLHMVLVLNKDGNLAMAKMKMGSVIQECATSFR